MKQHRHTCSLGTRLEHLQVWLPPRRCLEHLPTRKETRFVSKWQLMKTQNGVKMFQDDWWCFLAAFPDALLGKMWIFFTCRTSQTVLHVAAWGLHGQDIMSYHTISQFKKKCFRRIQRTFVDDRRWPRFILIVTRSDDISCVTTKCKLDTVTSLKCWQNI